MLTLIQDPQIQQVLSPPNASPQWQEDLDKLISGDATLTRRSASEGSVRALQRLLIFLGYSTSSTGAFAIDGDFGRGSNRALAQFEFDYGLGDGSITRSQLAYPCNWQSARKLITSIPETPLRLATLEKMLSVAKENIDNNKVNCGNFDEAVFQLNMLHDRKGMNCREIQTRYGADVDKAVKELKAENGRVIQPEWLLAIIRQETAGVVRPRFEQHWLSKLARQNPETELSELRFQSMSFGLGQILGVNYNQVGAQSAQELYTLPMTKQIIAIARFLTRRQSIRAVVGKSDPTADDFKVVARFYNGSGYAAHHYDESLARWFREFKVLRG